VEAILLAVGVGVAMLVFIAAVALVTERRR
jgi:hypothetical protein